MKNRAQYDGILVFLPFSQATKLLANKNKVTALVRAVASKKSKMDFWEKGRFTYIDIASNWARLQDEEKSRWVSNKRKGKERQLLEVANREFTIIINFYCHQEGIQKMHNINNYVPIVLASPFSISPALSPITHTFPSPHQ